MSPLTTIVLLWLGFAGSHLMLSSTPVRRRLVARMGEQPFRGLYSLVAFAFFIPLVTTYFMHKHAGPVLWTLPHGPALIAIVYVAMAFAFVLIAAGLMQPSPAFVVPGEATPRAVHRITRHPVMMGLALIGLAHLLPNGSATDVAFFGGVVLFALVGSAHQDRRKLASGDERFRRFYEETPFFPFTGPASLRGLRGLFPAAAAVGVGVACIVRYFHASWFGG
jgi:uncharacterized membrane protein